MQRTIPAVGKSAVIISLRSQTNAPLISGANLWQAETTAKTKQLPMEHKKRPVKKDAPLKRDDLIVITGGGGFIGGNLAQYFRKKGFTNIRAIDKKPLH